MPFSEDDAVEIASASSEAQSFEKKYPDAVYNVEKMSTNDTAKWIKDHPKVAIDTQGKAPLKNLWLVELEQLEQERLILIINPSTKKILDTKAEKLEAEPEEEDLEEEFGEEKEEENEE